MLIEECASMRTDLLLTSWSRTELDDHVSGPRNTTRFLRNFSLISVSIWPLWNSCSGFHRNQWTDLTSRPSRFITKCSPEKPDFPSQVPSNNLSVMIELCACPVWRNTTPRPDPSISPRYVLPCTRSHAVLPSGSPSKLYSATFHQ